ncbi:hypothetical protein Tco_1269626 [Tanacetum coccineum]
MSTPKFTKTLKLVAFLDKPKENEGFEQIIDFLNASSIRYVLTVNPTIYTSCIKQFWAIGKWKFLIYTILQCLSAKITAWNEFSSTMASAIILFLDKQVKDMSKHKEIYVTPSHTKNIFANMKREGKGFSSRITPLFQTMMVQAPEEVGEGSAVHTDSYHTTTQPSTSRPQKKQSRRKQRNDSGPTEPITDEATNEEHVSTPSYDPSQSGEDKMKLNELMDLCAKLSDRILALENTNTSQAAEITTLKERVKKLEKKRRSKPYKLRRLYKERKIADLDADTKVTLIDESQGRNDKDLMFDTGVLNGDEVFQEPMVNTATTTSSIPVSAADPVTTTGEVVTTASVEILKELTLAQTLIKIKSAKPKVVTTVAITVTPVSSRPKAKDKDKAKMVEPEKPLKKKDQIEMFDKEMTRVNTFVDLNVELVKGSKTKAEGSSKRAREELESDNSNKQRIDEHVEAKGDDDQEEAKMKNIWR